MIFSEITKGYQPLDVLIEYGKRREDLYRCEESGPGFDMLGLHMKIKIN